MDNVAQGPTYQLAASIGSDSHTRTGSPQVTRKNSMGGDTILKVKAVDLPIFTADGPDDEPISVSVSMQIKKLIKIDVESQTFTAEVYIRSSWVDNRLQKIYDEDGRVYFANTTFDDSPKVNCWSPRIQVTNIKGVPDYFESWSVPSDGTRAKDFFKIKANGFKTSKYDFRVSQVMKLQATFLMKMKLRSFPLDEHYLEIRMKAATPQSVGQIHPLRILPRAYENLHGVRTAILHKYNPGDDGSANDHIVNRFNQEGNFEDWGWWADKRISFEIKETHPEDSVHHAIYSTIVCRLHVVRDPWYYVINVMVVHGVISTAALSTLTFSDVGQRIDSIFQLITAAIALKFVANQNLPKLPHSTKLDNYVFLGLTVMVTVIVECVLMEDADHDDLVRVDKWIGMVVGGLWATLNLYFAVLFITFWQYGKTVNERGWLSKNKEKRNDLYVPPTATCPCFRACLSCTKHYTLHEREELYDKNEYQKSNKVDNPIVEKF